MTLRGVPSKFGRKHAVGGGNALLRARSFQQFGSERRIHATKGDLFDSQKEISDAPRVSGAYETSESWRGRHCFFEGGSRDRDRLDIRLSVPFDGVVLKCEQTRRRQNAAFKCVNPIQHDLRRFR